MKIKHFECDPVCGFILRGYDVEEISKIAMEHVKTKHPKAEIDEEKLKGLITTVDTETELN